MSAITPTAVRTTSHYNQSELRPFSNQLASYVDYAALLQKLRSATKTFFVMNRVLKRSPKLRAGRSAARDEMQSIYDHVAFCLGLPLYTETDVRKSAFSRLAEHQKKAACCGCHRISGS